MGRSCNRWLHTLTAPHSSGDMAELILIGGIRYDQQWSETPFMCRVGITLLTTTWPTSRPGTHLPNLGKPLVA